MEPMGNNMSGEKPSVLIAGVGGGSLGLEIFKSLKHTGEYRLFGTDINKTAFGLSDPGFEKTWLLKNTDAKDYSQQLLDICESENISVIAPGAGATHSILSDFREKFIKKGVLLLLNTRKVIDLCSEKAGSMEYLEKHGIKVPASRLIYEENDLDDYNAYPCVVKPTKDSGGSNLVFMAEDREEALFFFRYLQKRGLLCLVQEYIVSSQEFTVGVLSSPEGEIISSIALRRLLDPKLSANMRYGDRIISSGWSQGEINDFENVRKIAEKISKVLDSRWALNVQGRLGEDGVFYPFEINPRHSGTTYLRTLAGFNEPHILLQHCLYGNKVTPGPLKPGYYLRSFTENYLKKD